MQDFEGRRVLITTGPTREAIDAVRFISNRSSGKMGLALASEAYRRGADVTVVHGPIPAPLKIPSAVTCRPVVTASEMRDAVVTELDSATAAKKPYDVVIMAAAVADYRPEYTAREKKKKVSAPPSINVVPNIDILQELGEVKADNRFPLLVGFAVETGEVEDLLVEVRRKMTSKNADLMVGNLADDAFDMDTNRVWLVSKTGKEEEVSTTYKTRIAVRIFDAVSRQF